MFSLYTKCLHSKGVKPASVLTKTGAYAHMLHVHRHEHKHMHACISLHYVLSSHEFMHTFYGYNHACTHTLFLWHTNTNFFFFLSESR